MTTSLLQARQLIALLGEHGRDLTSCSLAFDHWCAARIRPWFDDHVYWDADLIRRWSGQDVDLSRPLPPDLIMAAAQADPEIARAVGPYQAMRALPASLDAVQARARDIYATGWRPPAPPGPTRDELAALVTAAASSRSHPAQHAALPATAARPYGRIMPRGGSWEWKRIALARAVAPVRLGPGINVCTLEPLYKPAHDPGNQVSRSPSIRRPQCLNSRRSPMSP